MSGHGGQGESINHHSHHQDACVPHAVTDFVFDLYDSVVLSQRPLEQAKLYLYDFHAWNARYFSQSPWPSPQVIASECNGHPLFLALYREWTHRQWSAAVTTRPTLRDRCEGWHVYRELFEEILEEEEEEETFYILPTWCFEILHEFVYQFQGFCQVRAAVYASARKHGLVVLVPEDANANANANANVDAKNDSTLDGEGNAAAVSSFTTNSAPSPSSALVENWQYISTTDAWDVESVFGYLHKLIRLGNGGGGGMINQNQHQHPPINPNKPIVYSYLSLFARVALSRLECLLGDYTACLEAVDGLVVLHDPQHSPKVECPPEAQAESEAAEMNDMMTTTTTSGPDNVLHSVVAARVSIAYHTAVSCLMLRRYRDAMRILCHMCAGFSHLVAAAAADAVEAAASTSTSTTTPNAHSRVSSSDNKDNSNKEKEKVNNQNVQQLMKQYDRMISLLVILTTLVPNSILMIGDDATRKAIREKQSKEGGGGSSSSNANITGAATGGGGTASGSGGAWMEEFFASPKFISVSYGIAPGTTITTSPPPQSSSAAVMIPTFHNHQINLFVKEMQIQQPYRTLRSYLKFYTSLPLHKLAAFYDMTSIDQVVPLLLSYKMRMRQLETISTGSRSCASTSDKDDETPESTTTTSSGSSSSRYKTALDLQYYITGGDPMVHVDEPERQRRFETHFVTQIAAARDIFQRVSAMHVSHW